MENREYARELRRWGWTLPRIATELGMPTGTVYYWIRDLPRPPRTLWSQRRRGPGKLERRKADEIAAAKDWASERLRSLSDDAFFAAGIALYAGEGSKRDGSVGFPNTNPAMIAFFCSWLRRYFQIDEARLRAVIYLHEDLEYEPAVSFWSELTGIPAGQFTKPYRAEANPTRRLSRHLTGCMTVRYHCTETHRRIVSLCEALLSCPLVDPA